jgi:tetratricopeptide (TPR) repeat protein
VPRVDRARDSGNAESFRCLGQALQAQGYHQDAIAAFRKAKQYDPSDRSLDAAIDRSQKGIVADFLNRYRRYGQISRRNPLAKFSASVRVSRNRLRAARRRSAATATKRVDHKPLRRGRSVTRYAS